MRITVAGVGYVGLSLACLFSQHNDVIAIDINKNRVAHQLWYLSHQGCTHRKVPGETTSFAYSNNRRPNGLLRCKYRGYRHANKLR